MKTSTQNLAACSQRQIHTVDTCKRLSHAKISQTFTPIKYKQPLPTHPSRKYSYI